MADTKLSALPSATLSDADEVYINDGGTSAKATIAALRTALGGVGFIPLDITSLREIGVDTANQIGNAADGAAKGSGGILAADTTPALKRLNLATDKALIVDWPLGNLDEVQYPPLIMPPDLSEVIDLTLHFLVRMSGGTDTTTHFDVQVFDGIGDTEMGGITSNFTSSLAELTVTIANANVSGNPTGVLNVALVPTTAHGTDSIQLFGSWMEYTKKLPA